MVSVKSDIELEKALQDGNTIIEILNCSVDAFVKFYNEDSLSEVRSVRLDSPKDEQYNQMIYDLCEIITKPKSVVTNLAFNFKLGKHWGLLTEALKDNKSITFLAFADLSDENVPQVVDLLSSNRQIKSLEIEHIELNDESAALLAGAIDNSSLQSFECMGGNLSSDVKATIKKILDPRQNKSGRSKSDDVDDEKVDDSITKKFDMFMDMICEYYQLLDVDKKGVLNVDAVTNMWKQMSARMPQLPPISREDIAEIVHGIDPNGEKGGISQSQLLDIVHQAVLMSS